MKSAFQKRYDKLNEKQREAVDHIEGPLLVVAGPGSGKTELIGLRTANIVKVTDTPPENVLCLTFTDTASSNMRERLIELMGEDGYRVPVHTFHSFCVEVMSRYKEFFYDGVSFYPADEIVKISIIQEIIKEMEEDDPLSTYHPRKGYIYLSSLKDSIADLKKEGLSPEEFKDVLKKNEEEFSFIEDQLSFLKNRVTSKSTKDAQKALKNLEKCHKNSLSFAVGSSLKRAILNKKLSEFKSKILTKTDSGHVLKERAYIDKMNSLAAVYKRYEQRMHEEGYYDFEDMLIYTISRLKNNEALLSTLQEKYLYIMVDEFQDTSGVQMRLLHLLNNNIANEERPNMCVVGDDDQAIYRFQGAEVSNIVRFKENYRDVKIVTLIENYRNTQQIIDTSLDIVKKGEERLENIIPEVSKQLRSTNKKRKGKIKVIEFKTKEEEYSFVSSKLKETLKKKNASDVAVISRFHKDLRDIFPYLEKKGIPVFYRGNENIIDMPHIRQIIGVLRFAEYLCRDTDCAEEILPEILSYPFWNISREKVWEVSVKSQKEGRSWLSCMKEIKGLSDIREFLIDLGVRAQSEPVDELIDIIIGTKESTMKSPFKEYYFPDKQFMEEQYLQLLFSLRRFIHTVNEHKKGRLLKVCDVIQFVDLCQENGISVSQKDSYGGKESVSLITSHSAKGMEFDTVFILNCKEEAWNNNRGRGTKLPFPLNLPLKDAGDNEDDRLRIFYVTLTRAKSNIFLTSHKEGEKKGTPLRFISSLKKEESTFKKEAIQVSESFRTFNANEKELILPLIEKYKLSPTGLCLFLDVVEGGPQRFLEDVILRFPKKKSPPVSFGTAMHATIKDVYMSLKSEGTLPKEDECLSSFYNHLQAERLSQKDMEKYMKKGKRALQTYLQKANFDPRDEIERSFSGFCGIEIVGKIDKMSLLDDQVTVVDFKTGKIVKDWKGKDDYEKRKIWRFRKQLIFYKILAEESREFSVSKGIIEFLEPYREDIFSMSLDFQEKEVDRTKNLIKGVGKMIKEMNFPSVESYEKNYKGIIKMEEDILLKEK